MNSDVYLFTFFCPDDLSIEERHTINGLVLICVLNSGATFFFMKLGVPEFGVCVCV